jgi:hypothetical protein
MAEPAQPSFTGSGSAKRNQAADRKEGAVSPISADLAPSDGPDAMTFDEQVARAIALSIQDEEERAMKRARHGHAATLLAAVRCCMLLTVLYAAALLHARPPRTRRRTHRVQVGA